MFGVPAKSELEQIFTIRPLVPVLRMMSELARATRKVPVRLTSMMRRQCAASTSSQAMKGTMAALLTRMSTPPAVCITASWRAVTEASSDTSQCTAKAPLPISSATFLAPASFTSATTTRAPSPASRAAIALPMPCAAPVTIAVFPSKRPAIPKLLRKIPRSVGSLRPVDDRHGGVDAGADIRFPPEAVERAAQRGERDDSVKRPGGRAHMSDADEFSERLATPGGECHTVARPDRIAQRFVRNV